MTKAGWMGIVAALLALALRPAMAARTTLDMYFIDVEGGQSTLFVTPAGESLLVDTGWSGNNGRDPGRILAAARDAGVTKVDYLLITHFHPDHDGGVVDLAQQMPIGTFIDHGGLPARSPEEVEADPRWPATIEAFNAYVPVRARGRHLEAKPGDRLPLKGVDGVFVSSAAATIAKPLPGAGQRNAACEPSPPAALDPIENPRSTGFHLRFGKFRFVDLGDLSGAPLFALICPNNLLGPIDLYLVPHHGGSDQAYSASFAAVQPRAAILNNGATKGADNEIFPSLRRVRGLEDVWQLHRSTKAGVENFPDDHIANLDESTGHWIKASAKADGSFTVTNGRTGVTKRYGTRSGTSRPTAAAVPK